MSLQSAVMIKESITHNTGYSARVCIQNGQFEAEAILPGTEKQLSTIQRSALYVIYRNSGGSDDACGINAALQSGVFDCRSQAESVLENLASFGWLLRTYTNRYALSEKGRNFVMRRLGANA
ncbi:MAG TPA: hypothetical protein DCS87_11800 [Rheinheimera sp.]|nr:hypothetical protein [Rheinheimera sp.]